MPVPKSLPPSPDPDRLRREAKRLLRAVRAGEPDAVARTEAHASGVPLSLSTAQLVIAREHGCRSWPALVRLAESVRRGAGRYDEIGTTYSTRRRADPRIAARIEHALGDARSVVHVGAGTGSYEPSDRTVVPVEPSSAMRAQRPAHLPPALAGVAESLPLDDDAVDAALAVLTIHHWADRGRGLAELRRVARRRVVIVTVDVAVEAQLWLFADYAPDILARDRREFPAVEELEAALGVPAEVEVLPVPADCADGFLLAFWNRPERLLDPLARAATSGLARLSPERQDALVEAIEADLASGRWDERHGHLRRRDQHDCGLRLLRFELG